VRVIAGEKGGQRLLAPPGRETRPTSDRVREAAFSMLESLGVVDEAEVWDLFAGSGAMGIEALSRGASHVTFVEQAPGAVAALRSNLAKLGYGPGVATVVSADVLRWVNGPTRAALSRSPSSSSPKPSPPARNGPGDRSGAATIGERAVDLVTADPPYAWQGWDLLFRWLTPLRPVVLAETGEALMLPTGWRALRSKRYGGTVVTLACPLETAELDQGPG
jgi:16S rRNA (guanine966-N2)-methyltransferase